MFQKNGINQLYNDHREMLNNLVEVREQLCHRFYKMDNAIDALMLAAMSGEALVMIGPPGTAKSRLVRSFCHLIGLIGDAELLGTDDRPEEIEAKPHADYFEYLLTQFTEPSELFGFYDISRLEDGLFRIDDNMMQKARVVFLDEVFNASSAILNSLLTFMNERKFHDRGRSIKTPLKLLVGATNFPPQDRTLKAIYDRFLVRVWLDNVASEKVQKHELGELLSAGWSETHAASLDRKPAWSGLLDDFAAYQASIDRMTGDENGLELNLNDPLLDDLAELTGNMVRYELSDMSNRRIIKLLGLALSHCLLRAARNDDDAAEMTREDLTVFIRYSLDREDPNMEEKLHQNLERSGTRA